MHFVNRISCSEYKPKSLTLNVSGLTETKVNDNNIVKTKMSYLSKKIYKYSLIKILRNRKLITSTSFLI